MRNELGEVFDDARGDPRTLLHNFKSTPLGCGRYLMTFALRADMVVIRQHTATQSGLREVAIGFTTSQLEELRDLLPALIEESRNGRTSEAKLEEARRSNLSSPNPAIRAFYTTLYRSE